MNPVTIAWALAALCAVYLGLTESTGRGRAFALVIALVFAIGAWASDQ